MPFLGLGLHAVLALLCAIHVVRTRQQLYWLFILFAFPLLGVYFFAVYLPNSRLERGALRAVSAAAKALDPQREVREARAALEDAPTAQNQMRLAAALLDAGAAEEAAEQYTRCLSGPFAADLDIRLGAARAFTECQRYAQALTYVDAIRQERSDFRAEAVGLLMARCHAGTSSAAQARAEFESAVDKFGTFEAKAEYAIWTLATGDQATAARLGTELEKIASRWNPLTRDLNAPVYRRYQAAKRLAIERAV